MNTNTTPQTPTPAAPVVPVKKGKGRTPGATSYLIVPLKSLMAAGLGENAPVMISRRWARESRLNFGTEAISADSVTAYRKANIEPASTVSVVNLADEPVSADSQVIVEDDAPTSEPTATPAAA